MKGILETSELKLNKINSSIFLDHLLIKNAGVLLFLLLLLIFYLVELNSNKILHGMLWNEFKKKFIQIRDPFFAE